MVKPIDLGLDFGSIIFRAAYMLDGEVVPIPISDNERTWSGAVFTIGPEARKPFLFDSLKSRLGPAGQLILFGPNAMTITDLVHELLARFKVHVEDYIGGPIGRVIIAVPGYYSAVQRAEIRQIAQAVEFQQVELVDDCLVAALGYTTLNIEKRPLRLLVFSTGFMGLEVNLVKLDQTDCQIIAGQGGPELSGRDVDRLLMERCVAEAARRNVFLPFIDDFDQLAWYDFRETIEETKKRLGLGEDVRFALPANVTGNFPLPMVIRVADFEAAIQGYVDQAMATVQQVLAAGQTNPAQVDKVLLVGGTTRLPSFQRGLTHLFGPKLIQPREDLLARGAALYAVRQSAPVITRPEPATLVNNSDSTRPAGRVVRTANPAKIQNPPTPEAIVTYAQTLAQAGYYEAARTYLSQVMESIQIARIRIEEQWME
ncbi:MAG: Hsp70 family protein [Anaerolineaceae bacterium]|nr:Hsp70 family protein [Anaerolineaceae bacterium]